MKLVRMGALAVVLSAVSAGCGPQTSFVSERMGGQESTVPLNMPDPVDRTMADFSVHLGPTVLLWAKQGNVGFVRIVEQTLTEVRARLHSPPCTVNIEAGTYGVIPDVGIGGVTDAYTGRVQISIDSRTPLGLKTLLQQWIPRTLAHELDHAKRVIDGPGYGSTLGEQLVSEGVAESFVRELYPDGPTVPWTKPLPDVRRIWALAKPHLGDIDEAGEHDRWFYGKDGLPRFALYRLGFAVVESYLAKHKGMTAAEVTTTSAREVLAAF